MKGTIMDRASKIKVFGLGAIVTVLAYSPAIGRSGGGDIWPMPERSRAEPEATLAAVKQNRVVVRGVRFKKGRMKTELSI
jgi:hypothetical protein